MMLQVDLDLRFSALQVLEHPWVNVSIFRLVDAACNLAPLSSFLSSPFYALSEPAHSKNATDLAGNKLGYKLFCYIACTLECSLFYACSATFSLKYFGPGFQCISTTLEKCVSLTISLWVQSHILLSQKSDKLKNLTVIKSY